MDTPQGVIIKRYLVILSDFFGMANEYRQDRHKYQCQKSLHE